MVDEALRKCSCGAVAIVEGDRVVCPACGALAPGSWSVELHGAIVYAATARRRRQRVAIRRAAAGRRRGRR